MAVKTDTYGLDVVFNTKDGEKNLTRLGTVTDRATGKVKNLVSQKGYLFYSIKRIASYSAIFSFFGGLIKMLGDVIELELRLAEVNTLIDKTNQDAVKSYNNVVDALLHLDSHLGDAINLTKGLYEIISAGVTDPQQAFKLLVVSAKYAKVGLTDLATASSSLTAVMKAYGFEAEQMRKVSDYLFASVREGKFHTDELNAAIGKVLPTAAAMNVDIREVTAALAIMTQRGLDVNEAATSLNRMLITFLRPLDKAKKRFQELGWAWGRGAFEGKGLIGALQDLESASKRYSDLLPIIFRRQRALRGAFILQGEGLRDLEDMYFRIDQAATGVGVVHEEWKRITKTVREEMHALYASLIQVFSALLASKGTVAAFIGSLRDMLVFLLENIKAVMAFVTALWLIPKVMTAIRVGFIQTMIVQRAYSAHLIAGEGFIMGFAKATRVAAAATAKFIGILKFASPLIAVALGIFLYYNKIIDEHKKSLDRDITSLKEQWQVYGELVKRMRLLAKTYEELTGKVLEWRIVTKEAARESLIAQINKDAKSQGWKVAFQQILDFAKKSGVKWTELGKVAGDAWAVVRGERVETADRYQAAIQFLDDMAKGTKHLEKVTDLLYKKMVDNTEGLARALIAADAKLRGLAKNIQKAQRLLMSDPIEIAFRFDKDEIKLMLDAVKTVMAGELTGKEESALKLFGIDLAQFKLEAETLATILGEAFAKVDKVKRDARIDDYTRAFTASLNEIRYTSETALDKAISMFDTWNEAIETNPKVFKLWAIANKAEVNKILATLSQDADPAIRAFLESMLAVTSTSVNALEKVREKYQKVFKKVADDQEKIASKITQLQNEYMGEQYKNILEQFKRESIAYKNRADEKLVLAIQSGVDIATATEEHAKSMLQIQEWGQEAAKVSQYRALKERLDEFKETLNHMQQNTQQRIDTTHVMAEEAIKFLHTLGIEDEAFMELLEGVISKYFEKIRVETEAGRDAMQEYIKFFRSLATSLGFISDTLNDLAESMGAQGAALEKMAELFSIASDAVDGFAKGLKTFDDADALSGLAATLGKIAGTIGIIIAAFKFGWDLGKFLKGLFGGDTRTEAEKTAAVVAENIKIIQKALEDLGDVSDEVAKKINDLYQKGIPIYIGRLMSLNDLIDDIGINMKNFVRYLEDMVWALGIGTTAWWTMEEAAEEAGEAFGKLIEYAKKMGIEGHKAILDFIKKARELGYEIKELNDYIESQLSMAAEGLYKMIKWVAQDAVDAWNAMKDLNKEKKKLINQMARYQRQMDAAEEGSKAWLKAKERVEDLYDEILKLDKELAKHQDVLNNVSNATVRQLKRLGVITAAVFNAMWAEGVPMLEIFNKMGDAVFALMDRYKALGLEVPKYLQSMFKQFRLFRKYPEFFEGLQGLQEALEGLANSGYLTQESFKAIYQEAKRYFELLTRAKSEGGMGLGDEDAIGMMYPLLQKMWWYAQQYDLKLPKSIRDLIDQAKGLGFKFEKPVLERQLDAIDRLNDRMVWHRKGLRDQLLDTNRWLERIYNKGGYQHGSTGVPGGLAFLHRGEAVLPESVTNALKRFFVGGGSIGESGGGGMLEAHIYIDGEKTYKALVPHIRKGGAYADFEVDGIGVR